MSQSNKNITYSGSFVSTIQPSSIQNDDKPERNSNTTYGQISLTKDSDNLEVVYTFRGKITGKQKYNYKPTENAYEYMDEKITYRKHTEVEIEDIKLKYSLIYTRENVIKQIQSKNKNSDIPSNDEINKIIQEMNEKKENLLKNGAVLTRSTSTIILTENNDIITGIYMYKYTTNNSSGGIKTTSVSLDRGTFTVKKV
jgi:hypothetical protein